MATQVVLPALGESVVEGTIVRWLVAAGDRVAHGQPLLEVETDKANAELPSTEAGWVRAILVEAGRTVPVGTPLLEIGDATAASPSATAIALPDSTSPSAPASVAPAPSPAAPLPAPFFPPAPAPPMMTQPYPAASFHSPAGYPAPVASLPAAPSAAPPGPPPAMRPGFARSALAQTPVLPVGFERPWNRGGIIAAPTAGPVVRIPLTQPPPPPPPPARVTQAPPAPSGRFSPVPPPPPPPTAPASSGAFSPPAPAAASAGLPVTAAVPAASAVATAGTPFGAPPMGRYYRPPQVRAGPADRSVRFSRRRGIIAEHMVYSKHVSPHVPCVAEVDMTAVLAARQANKETLAARGVPLTVLAFLCKAVAEALREFPSVNASVGEDELILRGEIHLGVAVETDEGLVVPVVRNADTLSVGGIAAAIRDHADRARSKKLTVDDMSGGTFTVSNPGRRGNLFGAAVINQPQVGIIRMGEIVRRPVVRESDGEECICIRSMMYLSLSYDHRVIDGVTGNGFLFRVRELLEAGLFEV